MANEGNSHDTRGQPAGQSAQPWRGRAGRALVVFAFAAITAVGVVALVLKSQEPATNPSLADLVGDVDPGPIHVHGLGINPADGSLLIATHTGTYRVEPDEDKAELIGANRQDTMGFTVAGPDRFLGSGHPDPNAAREGGLSPLLGLIESRDAGRSWQSISLSGQADFHVLRFAGRRVYGYDATNDRLLLSTNLGRTWRRVSRPAPLIDLVVDPRDSAHAVASTLQRLAEQAQVLTITHLPQIASVAERHFRVEKVPGDPTHTRIEELDDVLRREELERMLGGQEFLASLKNSVV